MLRFAVRIASCTFTVEDRAGCHCALHCCQEREVLCRPQGQEEHGSQVQGTVLEPCKVGVKLDLGGDAGDIQLTLSDLRMNLSPDVLELALSLQSSVLEPLVQPPPDRYTHPGNKPDAVRFCSRSRCAFLRCWRVCILLLWVAVDSVEMPAEHPNTASTLQEVARA